MTALEQVARRDEIVRANAAVVRRTQAAVRGAVGRRTILAELHDGREE